jgi:hypothetical protein
MRSSVKSRVFLELRVLRPGDTAEGRGGSGRDPMSFARDCGEIGARGERLEGVDVAEDLRRGESRLAA